MVSSNTKKRLANANIKKTDMQNKKTNSNRLKSNISIAQFV